MTRRRHRRRPPSDAPRRPDRSVSDRRPPRRPIRWRRVLIAALPLGLAVGVVVQQLRPDSKRDPAKMNGAASRTTTVGTTDGTAADTPAVPDIDWSGIDAPVAQAVQRARNDVIENPDDAGAWGRLGMVWHAHSLTAQAIECYERAAALDESDYRWPYLHAVCLTTIDNTAAVEQFARAAVRNPEGAAFHVRYANALLREDRVPQARAQFQRAIELDDRIAHAHAGLGQIALRENDADAALDHLQRAYRLDPLNREVVALLATVHRKLGRPEDAETFALCARGLPHATRARDPLLDEVDALAVSARACTARGNRLAAAGKYEEALDAYRRALRAHEPTAVDYANAGAALARLKRYDEAVVEFKKALGINPDEVFAHNNLGLTYLWMNDDDNAETHLNRALELQPDYAGAHYNLGLLRSKQGKPDEAVRHFRDALEADPADSGTHLALANELARIGRVEDAIRHWTRAKDINPFNLDAVYKLGLTLAQRNRFAEAAGVLWDGVERAPRSSRMANALAWILATCPDDAVRDESRAAMIAARACEGTEWKDPASLDVLAAALAELGDFDSAVRMAETALARATETGNARAAARVKARLTLYRNHKSLRAALRSPARGPKQGAVKSETDKP